MKTSVKILSISFLLFLPFLLSSCLSMRDADSVTFEAKLKRVKEVFNNGVGNNIDYSSYAGNKNVRLRKTVTFTLPVTDEISFIGFIIEGDTHPDKGRGEVKIPVSSFSKGEKKTVRVEVEVIENDPPRKGKTAKWEFVFDVTRR